MMDTIQHMAIITTQGVPVYGQHNVKMESMPAEMVEIAPTASQEMDYEFDIWQQEVVSMAALAEADNQVVTFCLQTTKHVVAEWEKVRTELSLTDSKLLETLLKLCEEKIQQNFCSVCHSALTHFCTKCCPVVNATIQTPSTPLLPTSVENKSECIDAEDKCVNEDTGDTVPVAGHKSDCSSPAFEEPSSQNDVQCMSREVKEGQDSSYSEEQPLVMCTWCSVSCNSVKDLYRHMALHATTLWQQQHLLKNKTCSQKSASNLNGTSRRLGPGRPRKMTLLHQVNTSEVTSCLGEIKDDNILPAAENSEDDKDVLMNKSKSYICLQCGSHYRSLFMFNMHLQKKHIQKKAFQCCRCETSFDSTKMLVDHVELHLLEMRSKMDQSSKAGDYRCAVCCKRFNYLGRLVNHALRHPGEKVFFCSKCQCRFHLVADYTGHSCPSNGSTNGALPCVQVSRKPEESTSVIKEGIENEVLFKSTVCGDSTVSTTEVPEFEGRKISSEPPYQDSASENERVKEKQPDLKNVSFKCPDCPAEFKFYSRLVNHSQKHTGKNAFSCSDCPLTFNSKSKLHAHQEKDHWKSMPIMCRTCGKVLKNMLALEQHEVLHTDELPFPCKYCEERFKNQAALSRHCRKHTGMEYRCSQCSASFYSFTQYNYHMKTHSDFKPFLCTTCGEAFTNQQKFASHTAKHNPAQFICEHCGKAFHEKGTHRMHVRTHLKVKPFQCHTCGKGFVANNKLQLHMSRVHLGLKPHKCKLCGVAYATPSRLNEHIRASHTSERPYKCPKCDKRFAKSGCRQAHLRTHSKIKCSNDGKG